MSIVGTTKIWCGNIFQLLEQTYCSVNETGQQRAKINLRLDVEFNSTCNIQKFQELSTMLRAKLESILGGERKKEEEELKKLVITMAR